MLVVHTPSHLVTYHSWSYGCQVFISKTSKPIAVEDQGRIFYLFPTLFPKETWSNASSLSVAECIDVLQALCWMRPPKPSTPQTIARCCGRLPAHPVLEINIAGPAFISGFTKILLFALPLSSHILTKWTTARKNKSKRLIHSLTSSFGDLQDWTAPHTQTTLSIFVTNTEWLAKCNLVAAVFLINPRQQHADWCVQITQIKWKTCIILQFFHKLLFSYLR